MSPASANSRRAIPEQAREGEWVAPDGHRLRRIDWPGGDAGSGSGDGPGAGRGSLLFLVGRGDAYEKYLETLAHWHECGWSVTALDWRGQAGSGRLGIDPVTGHVDDFADWVDDLAAFWREWSHGAAEPQVAIGHSMGGHLLLRALAERRIDPAAAVLIAPMLGFAGPAVPDALLHLAARTMARMGDRRRPAWKWGEKPGELPQGRIALLTHDADRYADEGWWREERPELVMGPASWGWVERACDSMRALMRRGLPESVAVPVLLLSARSDRLVCSRAIRRAAERLPKGELVEFGGEAAHELLREADPVRDRALAAIDRFLSANAPVRP